MTIAISLCVGIAALLALFLGLATGFYSAKPPTGPDSMSLATPMLVLIALWILTLVATWLCVAHGGLDWISARPLIPFAVGTLGVIGLALASGGSFVLWSQLGGALGPPLAILGTVLLPLAVEALLLACAWTEPAELAGASWARTAGLALAPWALVGLGLGGWMLVERARKNARLVDERLRREQELAEDRALDPALPHAARVSLRLAKLDASAPFAEIVALLPDADPEAARAVVERAARAPEPGRALDAALRGYDAAQRVGAAEYVRLAAATDPAGADALAAAVRATAQAVRTVGMMSGLESEDFRIATEVMLRAARRFPAQPLAPAIAELRAAIAATSDEPERSQALAVIDGS